MSGPAQLSYGGSGDARAGALPVADLFRRHADALTRAGCSPPYAHLMRGAADDIDAGEDGLSIHWEAAD